MDNSLLFKDIRTVVTAINIHDDVLLAGIGGFAYIFQCVGDCWRKLFHEKVFEGQNIHGIIMTEDNPLVIYGGRKISVWDLHVPNASIRNLMNTEVKDWIMKVKWIQESVEPSNIHSSSLCLITAHSELIILNQEDGCIVKRCCCWDRCILYSANISNDIWDDLILFGGTVYNQIIIWSANDNSQHHLLQKFKAHQGVIFSVTYDDKTQRIGSTSDDRTIRIWQVKFKQEGDDAKTPLWLKWKGADVSLSITVFGHTARVWSCLLLPNGNFVSIGEDGLACEWDSKGEAQNRNLFNGGIRCIDSSQNLIALGGMDGGISVLNLDQIDQQPVEQSEISFESNRKTPKHLCLDETGSIIVYCEGGEIFKRVQDEWKLVFSVENLKNYCVLALSKDRKYLALGGLRGEVYILKVGRDCLHCIFSQNIITEKIFSLNWLDRTLLICGPEGSMTLWNVDVTAKDLKLMGRFGLPPSKERWVTCVVRKGRYFICGDRSGSLFLYDWPSAPTLDTVHQPVDLLTKLHQNKGVQDLISFDDFFMSCGRDGTVRKITIIDGNLKLISSQTLKMDWAARIKEIENFGIVVAGFHDTNFVIWSLKESRFLLKIKCGGGHRSWDFSVTEFDEISVSFVKNKMIHTAFKTIGRSSIFTVMPGYHSKTINSGSAVHLNGIVFLATGGEDNALKICDGDLNEVASVTSHLSSIRVVSAASYDESSASRSAIVFSAGGRGQVKVWKLSVENLGSLTLAELSSHMIRPEDSLKRPWKLAAPLVDPETRYMDVCWFPDESQNSYLVCCACSDGFLRIFKFHEPDSSLIFVGEYRAKQCCMLKIFQIVHEGKRIVGVLSTDGSVTFTDVDELMKGGESRGKDFNLHSNGINSCDRFQSSDLLFLLTGGDDTRLSLSYFKADGSGRIDLVDVLKKEDCHFCQITGVKITNELMLSAGLDQRLNLHKWKLEGGRLVVESLASYVTSIPDVHGFIYWKRDCRTFVTLYGIGMETIEVKRELL